MVSLLASSTEIVCALGCGERLVARSHGCDHPEWVRRLPAVTLPEPAPDAPAAAVDGDVRALPAQDTPVDRVDADALARLAPDLVLTQAHGEAGVLSLRDVEAALGEARPGRPRVVALEPGSLAGIWLDVRRVADALGVPERGVQLVARLQRRMKAIAVRAAALPRPRLACLAWLDPPRAAGGWMPELVAMAGADDAFGRRGERAATLTVAALADADPDAIVVAPCGYGLARARAEMPALEHHAAWPRLRAVREGRVFLADGDALFNRPGPRVVEALEALAEALHPGAFRFGHEGTGWESWRPAAVAAGEPAGHRAQSAARPRR